MLYNSTYTWLGWPRPDQVFAPEGAGARVYAEFVQKKIGGALELAYPGLGARVGVIAADPTSNSTQNPLAVVCEFARPARDVELDLAHTLAWNFSRTALLITLEPHRLIAWSCYREPTLPDADRRVCEMSTFSDSTSTATPQQRAVRELLHWVNLITNRAQRDLPEKFPADGRADALLLKNLRHVRRELLGMDLPKVFCHDLLARVIFTQFLFHRKDRDGNAFFGDRMMRRLHEDGLLSKYHADLASILAHKTDTYALFRWMDERFNGNLFPGKDSDDGDARDAAWRAERDAVTKAHLKLLADLVRGDLDIAGQQLTLWPRYSFDTIPLEFISSIYEEFLNEDRHRDKAYYTPSHLVDYVLDAVLPWNDKNWSLRVLDPCCGSGIFLVKAFQRLIHRWRLANPGKEPLVTDLRPILANNLVGVDKNPEAVRVACFSLYLAMADAIEPKHYVTRENVKVFPPLRGTRLLAADFFDEKTEGIRTKQDADSFDLVIGNAPWGDNSIMPPKNEGEPLTEYKARAKGNPTDSQRWAKENRWHVANLDIGPLFLGKAACLVNRAGRVAMIQTASLLYWRDSKAAEIRRHLFTSFTFDEITNLSALRRDMFASAIGPACVVVFGKQPPQPETTLYYFTPKPMRVASGSKRRAQAPQGFAIEPQDISTITHHEAANDPIVWPVLALGGKRDMALIRRLMLLPNLARLEAQKRITTRIGVIPGDRKKRLSADLERVSYFDATQFPPDTVIFLDASKIPKWREPRVHSKDSTDFEPFKMPQLLIKQSFSAKSGRFRAALVKSEDPKWGVVCKKTYFTVRDFNADAAHVRRACVIYNSRLAAYFLSLTSSRIGHYNAETLGRELVTVPLPDEAPDLSTLTTFEAIDKAAADLCALTAADRDLIDDFLDHVLPDALRAAPGPSRAQTIRRTMKGDSEPDLTSYTQTFARVLQGTFGPSKLAPSTIYTEAKTERLPIRMITVHLDARGRPPLVIEPIEADGLLDQLSILYSTHLKRKTRAAAGDGLGFQRVAYFFQPKREEGASVMDVTIVKPDERRYWTRSMAMRDADQLAFAILKASAHKTTAT